MCGGNVRSLAGSINLIFFFWDGKGFVPGGLVGPGKALRRARGNLEIMEGWTARHDMSLSGEPHTSLQCFYLRRLEVYQQIAVNCPRFF